MNLNESINYLLSNGYLAMIEDQLTITNKLRRDYSEVKVEEKKRQLILSGRDFYTKFAEDAKVPSFIHMSNGQKFTVKYYTPSILAPLKKAIAEVGYEKLVEITKNYYQQKNLARTTLQKFISKEMWRDWMDIAGDVPPAGENKFED